MSVSTKGVKAQKRKWPSTKCRGWHYGISERSILRPLTFPIWRSIPLVKNCRREISGGNRLHGFRKDYANLYRLHLFKNVQSFWSAWI